MVANLDSKIKDSNFLLFIESNNKKSLNNFLFFILQYVKTDKTIIKISTIRSHVRKITILKSPHVNKTAQEQFESKKFATKVLFKTKSIKLTSQESW